MAEYQRKLESAADALARKQLGLEPRKEGVEENDRLPEIYERFKAEYLTVLEDSFEEVCGMVKGQLGVKHLSDDTMLIIANKINDKAISGDLKFVKDLTDDKEIAAVVQNASNIQKEQMEAVRAEEGEISTTTDGKENQIIDAAVAVPMTIAFAEQMKDLGNMYDNWRNGDMDSMRDKSKKYLEGDERKRRTIDLEADLLRKLRDAKTPEEKIKYTTILDARDGMSRSIEAQLQGIENGNTKVYAGAMFAIARMVAIDEDRSIDEIVNEFKAMAISGLGNENAAKMLEELECIKGVTDRQQAVGLLLDRFEEIADQEHIKHKDRSELERITYRKSKKAREIGQMTDVEIDAKAERDAERREVVAKSIRNRISMKRSQINYTEIQEVLDSRELLTERELELFVKALGSAAAQMGDMRLVGMHQEFAEKDKQERDAVTGEKDVAVEDVEVAIEATPIRKIDTDEGPEL